MRFITLLLASIFLTAASLNDARKATQALKRGEYDVAARLYQEAIDADPTDARLYFNYGNALYHLGEMEEARKAFETYREFAESPEERALADYNSGKMFADLEMYDEAASQFRQALVNNPDDQDARFNYELALRKQKESDQDEQEQDPENSNDQNEDQENDENQDQQDGDQNDQQDNQQDQQDQEQDENQGEEDQQPQPLDMTEQEAENILDALRQLERELLENRRKESDETQSRNDKDW